MPHLAVEQLEFDHIQGVLDDPRYLSEQLITYLGNKRSLLGQINTVIETVRERVGGRKLTTCDAFSGSGVVSRLLKRHSTQIWTNDLEEYASVISRAYLTNSVDVPWDVLEESVNRLNRCVEEGGGPAGFFREIYSPKDDRDIKAGERVFYTNENARRLDAYAQLIREEPESLQDLLLAPLLSAASKHANTSGVFKGFYKDSATGKGKFGGSGGDALSRITAPISLSLPVLSKFNCESEVLVGDSADLPGKIEEMDLMYLDPPYNQHPYGSNYFMLNLLVKYEKPQILSNVSGIPSGWNRSDYNVRQKSFDALKALINDSNSRFYLLSFSDDGFLDPKALKVFLMSIGKTQVLDIEYNTFRGSRNLSSRPLKITEHLFLLDKS